jgi:tetratricopeptide (TPR) repeat protein
MDPQTPYSRMRGSPGSIDYVQYPHQTLSYRGGDSDDLAVLYAAALESVGVPSAIIPMREDVIVAVRLESDGAAVRGFFADPADVLFIDEEAWIPVRMSMLREGFLRAWSEGAAMLQGEKDVREFFFSLEEAWREYPPAGIPDIRVSARKPAEDQVLRAFNNLVNLVVEREVKPRAERMREAFGPDGSSGRQRNALGVLYARYGIYDEALEEFRAAASAGYTRSHLNIGSIAFLMHEYETALTWYKKTEKDYPTNPLVLICLARTYYELDRFDEADRYFALATERRPELAERYSYLAVRITGAHARSSAAMDRMGDMIWEE